MTDRMKKRILPPTPEQPQTGVSSDSNLHSEDKLFIQLLDDLDNISGGGSQSIHRRRRAREIFSEWLFSQDVHNPQIMRLKMEQASGRRHSSDLIDLEQKKQIRQQHSCDVEPFQRDHSSRRSCGGLNDGIPRRGFVRRARPSSFHYPSETEVDPGYHTGNNAMLATAIRRRPPSAQTAKERSWAHLDLKHIIEAFNQNEQGLFMEMSEDGRAFRGSIRIHMNLTSPISISAQLPTFFDYNAPDVAESSQLTSMDGATVMTTFCLPKNTTKVIRISNFDTTQEVIQALLAKFNITDDPKKFVLFEKIEVPGKKSAMRQIKDDELPLLICLTWTDIGGIKTLETNKFILQENNNGESEILWKSFNVLELESFLNVLNREEAEHIDQVQMKYKRFKAEILKHLQQRHPNASSNEKRVPVFV